MLPATRISLRRVYVNSGRIGLKGRWMSTQSAEVQDQQQAEPILPGPKKIFEMAYTRKFTKAVQSGESGGRVSMVDCLTTPIAQTSAYTFKNTQQLIDFCEGGHSSFEYGRYGNPTSKVVEDKIASLEGAEDCLMSTSGLNSITTTLLALVPPGGHLVTTKDLTARVSRFIKGFLVPKMGYQHTEIAYDKPDIMAKAIEAANGDVFFAESPSSPLLRCVDLELVAEACKKVGTISVIDSTYATPFLQNPLDFGIDLVTHSASNAIAGHNDVMAGVVVGDKSMVQQIRLLHAVLGGVVDPHAAYLVLRGIKTMGIRVAHQAHNAKEIATYLSSVPQVERVYYPGLPSHPDYDIANKQMKKAGTIVSFVIKGGESAASKFLDALRVPYIAPNAGGVESIVEQPSISWDLPKVERHALGVEDGLIRYSCGLEDTVDLLTDLAQALKESATA